MERPEGTVPLMDFLLGLNGAQRSAEDLDYNVYLSAPTVTDLYHERLKKHLTRANPVLDLLIERDIQKSWLDQRLIDEMLERLVGNPKISLEQFLKITHILRNADQAQFPYQEEEEDFDLNDQEPKDLSEPFSDGTELMFAEYHDQLGTPFAEKNETWEEPEFYSSADLHPPFEPRGEEEMQREIAPFEEWEMGQGDDPEHDPEIPQGAALLEWLETDSGKAMLKRLAVDSEYALKELWQGKGDEYHSVVEAYYQALKSHFAAELADRQTLQAWLERYPVDLTLGYFFDDPTLTLEQLKALLEEEDWHEQGTPWIFAHREALLQEVQAEFMREKKVFSCSELIYFQRSGCCESAQLESMIVYAHLEILPYLEDLKFHLKDGGYLFLYNPDGMPLPYPTVGEQAREAFFEARDRINQSN